jgi:hypothetical protein
MFSAIQFRAAGRDVSAWYVRGEIEDKDVLNVWYTGGCPTVREKSERKKRRSESRSQNVQCLTGLSTWHR